MINFNASVGVSRTKQFRDLVPKSVERDMLHLMRAGQMIGGTVRYRVAFLGLRASGAKWDNYAKSTRKVGTKRAGFIVPPWMPQPSPQERFKNSYVLYKDRTAYAVALGRKPWKTYFVSGGMWKGWGVRAYGPHQVRLRFYGSSLSMGKRFAPTKKDPTRKINRLPNREKAYYCAKSSKVDYIVEFSEKEMMDVINYLRDNLYGELIQNIDKQRSQFLMRSAFQQYSSSMARTRQLLVKGNSRLTMAEK